MKKRGARLHPNSGAGPIKRDGSTATELYEVKSAGRVHQLKGDDLLKLFQQATREHKEGVYLVYFIEAGVTAEIRVSKEPPEGWMQ